MVYLMHHRKKTDVSEKKEKSYQNYIKMKYTIELKKASFRMWLAQSIEVQLE